MREQNKLIFDRTKKLLADPIGTLLHLRKSLKGHRTWYIFQDYKHIHFDLIASSIRWKEPWGAYDLPQEGRIGGISNPNDCYIMKPTSASGLQTLGIFDKIQILHIANTRCAF